LEQAGDNGIQADEDQQEDHAAHPAGVAHLPAHSQESSNQTNSQQAQPFQRGHRVTLYKVELDRYYFPPYQPDEDNKNPDDPQIARIGILERSLDGHTTISLLLCAGSIAQMGGQVNDPMG
jgi:hypothetical protein